MKYLNTLDSNAYRKVRPSNKSLLESFLKHLTLAGRCKGTVKAYRQSLRVFFSWNLSHNDNKDFIDITRDDFLEFQNVMHQDWKLKATTIRNIEASLSSLSNYVEEQPRYAGYKNLMRAIKTPRSLATQRQVDYNESEIDGLLDVLTEIEHYRDACIIALMVYSGMQKYDAMSVPLSCFDDPEIYYEKFYKIQVNDKWFYIIKDMFDPYLENWMEQRKTMNIKSKWLFPAVEDRSKHISLRRFCEAFSYIKDDFDSTFYLTLVTEYAIKEFIKLDISYELLREMSGVDKKDLITMYVSNRKEKQK